ncbi:protein spotted leaf 11 [Arachis duranensis]|uniref:Protein spotted leaf 11 n=1 Tax=Arachis duranensis TaxID=130453 RepID=A0A6P4B904_ARADU|nr:protein spotted leaf 11 [Arachis duranensis]XP_052107371.1 protein spotted leaf 11 [Arachis duranensis]
MYESESGDIDWENELRKFQNAIATGTKSKRIKAMSMLARYSKHAPEHVLARTIPFLMEILGHNNRSIDSANFSLQMASAYCLKCIACRSDELVTQMGANGAAQLLLNLLPHSDGMFLKVLVKCLLVVVGFCNTSRAVVATAGGLGIIVDKLSSCEDRGIRRYLLEILSLLALRRNVRREIVRLDALHYVVEAVGVGSMVSRERACQAIGMFGVTREGRRAVVELGAILPVVELFCSGDHTTKLVAGNTLGVISAHVDCIRSIAQAGAIPLYSELLEGGDPSGKDIAEDAFCVLAVDEANAIEIVGHLVRIMRDGDNEAKAAAANVVWDLSTYNHSIPVVRDSGVIPVLVELLGSGSNDVKENVSGAFSQMSYDRVNRIALSDAGVVPIFIDLLHDDFEELRDNAAEALVNFYEDPLYHDSVSHIIDVPSFRSMQNRLAQLRETNERAPVERMNIDLPAWNSDQIT